MATVVWKAAERLRASERSTSREHSLAHSRGSRDLLASLVTSPSPGVGGIHHQSQGRAGFKARPLPLQHVQLS